MDELEPVAATVPRRTRSAALVVDGVLGGIVLFMAWFAGLGQVYPAAREPFSPWPWLAMAAALVVPLAFGWVRRRWRGVLWVLVGLTVGFALAFGVLMAMAAMLSAAFTG
jgi:hypothetical protein